MQALQKVAIVLAGLVCIGQGGRVKTSAVGDANIPSAARQNRRHLPGDSPTAHSFAEVDESAVIRADTSGAANPSRAIALAFLMFDPTAAFKPGVPGMRAPWSRPAVTASRHVARGEGNRFGSSRLPVMSASGVSTPGSLETYEKLAADCLEEGCPVLTVEELLIQLKAVANPSAKMLQEIKDLDSKLAEVLAEQKTVEKLVAEVVASETWGADTTPRGKADPSLEKLASNCLDEGCPLLTVEDLLAKLKFVENPNAKLADTIQKLEASLKESKAAQSDVEKLVASLAGR